MKLIRSVADFFTRLIEADRALGLANQRRHEAEKAEFARHTPLETERQLLQFIHRSGGSVSTLDIWFSIEVERLAYEAASAGYLKIIGFKEGDDVWRLTDKGREQIGALPAPAYRAATIASAHS